MVVLLLGIGVLLVAVSFIFSQLDQIRNQVKPVPEEYQVVDADTGQPSPYYLEITPPEGETMEIATQWLEKCTGESGYYWLTHAGVGNWELFVYLPELQARLGDISRSNVTVRTENMGMHSVMHIYLTTQGVQTNQKESKQQLLHFAAQDKLERPGAVKVYVDGEPLESSGHCLYDRGQWNWYSN